MDEGDLFSSLAISTQLKVNIERMGFTTMFPIQKQTITPMLEGKDLLAAAKTGSGKTLAFLIPAVEMLIKMEAKPENGVLVLIIAPTRELAVQTNDCCTKLLQDTGITNGVSIGGTQKKHEAQMFSRGVNVLVATPGRLVDHIIGTPSFTLKYVKLLIMDEADRILEQGFHLQLEEIIRNLPEKRQTALFSATQTKNVDDLATVSFRQGTPLYIGVDDESESSTAVNLEQTYVMAPPDKRLMYLLTLIKRNKKKKIMVFFGTRSSVRFHAMIFKKLGVSVLEIHGDQGQQKRIDAFNEFKKKSSGALFCTDVAARGLDIPAVDLVIQYDPPTSEKEYIHRVGRSARAGAEGRALLFLMQSEKAFLGHLESAKVPLKELKIPKDKIMDVDLVVLNAMAEDRKLTQAAKEGLKSYLMGYESHPLTDSFDVTKLDIEGVAKSFGFDEMPYLDIPLSDGKKTDGSWIKREKRKQHK